jgi:hypothetical protein
MNLVYSKPSNLFKKSPRGIEEFYGRGQKEDFKLFKVTFYPQNLK